MKVKQIIAASTVFVCAATAHAQSAGSFILSGGWSYLMPKNQNASLGKNVGIEDYQGRGGSVYELNELANGGFKAENASALGLNATYFITDHIAGELALTTSHKLSLKGTGELAHLGTIGSVRQWSPALLLEYYFFNAEDKFRPYLGVGMSRTWFSKPNIDLPMSIPGTTNFSINNELSLSLILKAGFIYPFTDHLYGTVSVSYTQLEAEAKLRTRVSYRDSSRQAEWTRYSREKFKLNPVTTFVGIGYRF